jgi:hypothetical protein
MYRLALSRRGKKKLLRARWLFVLGFVVALAAVIWFVWVRPIENEATINSFEKCVAAGNQIQTSYPEVCLAKDGKRFINPKQAQAHRASLANQDDLVPPSNAELLNLDIQEWSVRVPLTPNTFDLSYSYFESGGSEYVHFSYKRLVRSHVCEGDIGLTMTRSILQHVEPFTPANPAPIAKVGDNYYYVVSAGSPCYDSTKPDQVAQVKQIAGDLSLTQATANLLTKLTLTPKQ